MDPTTERFLRLEAIFHQALAAPDGIREALVETECQQDRSLADEVRSLLEACNAEECCRQIERLIKDLQKLKIKAEREFKKRDSN